MCEIQSRCGFDLHSLKMRDTEHSFFVLGLSSACISSLKNCLLKSFACFRTVFYFSVVELQELFIYSS